MKGLKEKISKRIFKMNPNKKIDKIDHESDANSNATTFYFTLQNKDCVQLVKNATIHEGQIV